MQTNLPDIFAAGDVAQVYDAASGKWLVESLWAPAARQGECAGLNMAGAPTVYAQERAANVTRLTGLTTAIIGSIGRERDEDLLSITHGDSESWRDSPEAIVTRADYDINHLRILVGEKVLVGAVIMGEQSLAPIVRALVAGQVDISPIRQALILPGAPVAALIKDFWKGLSSNGNATKRE
jgi:NADPH-dependent 2,4-dienoyl-CoA reductase/sulfur reductase-like enzyme